MKNDDSINPYEASESVSHPIPTGGDASAIDYPGGLRAVGIAGIVLGALTGIGFSNGFGSRSFWTSPLILWCASFVLLGLALPGSNARRITRGFVSFFVSIALLIVYVPVCGFVMQAQDSAGVEVAYAWIVASVVAFTSVLLLGAWTIRHRARMTSVQLGSGEAPLVASESRGTLQSKRNSGGDGDE